MSVRTTMDAFDTRAEIEDTPLTPEELRLLNRLLSDPTQLPRKFKQWVTDHSSDTVDIAKSQVHGLISSNGSIILTAQSWEQLGAALCPMILPYPGSVAPTGWLPCDGRFLLESEYPTLFSFLGHAHDPIVSTGQFAIPDIRGRAIYGYDPNTGTGYMPFAGHDSAAVGGRGPWHHHEVPDIPTMINVGTQLAAGSNYPRFSPQDLDYATSGPPPMDGGSWYALNYIIASGLLPE